MIPDCTAIIMAGGDSQRMGRDKANLMVGDQTLLQSVIAAMQKIFPQVIVSVRKPRVGIDLPQICDAHSGVGMVSGGPLAGLSASLAHVTTPWAFVIACDMPFVAPAMVELLARSRGQYQAVVPVVQGYPQPLAAFYSGSCLPVIRAHLAAGRKNSLRAVLELLQVRYVDEAELLMADPALRSFIDLDTPQDMAHALKIDAAKKG